MRIAHLSDTHLGYTGVGLQRLVEDPYRPGVAIRQQEADIMRGFHLAIDRIVSHIKPALVVHSGDLFDTAHPAPYAVDFAMRQVRRLASAGIPFIVVEGDHSCPRITGQGQVLRLLLHLPNVYVVCGEMGRVEVDRALVHAIPHRALVRGQSVSNDDLDGTRLNILAAHGVADGYPFYNTSRHAAPLIVRPIANRFDYVALGHYHRFSQVRDTDRAFYAGSTAMVAQGDFAPGYPFGFVVADLAGSVPQVRREELETRPMHSYGLHDASGLSARDVVTFLENQVEAVPPADAYCNVVVIGLEPLARRELSTRGLEELFAGYAGLTVQLRVRERTREEAQVANEETTPRARFQRLVDATDGPPEFVAAVRRMGIELLDQAQSELYREDVEAEA